jgi:hypothetical protein
MRIGIVYSRRAMKIALRSDASRLDGRKRIDGSGSAGVDPSDPEHLRLQDRFGCRRPPPGPMTRAITVAAERRAV